MKFHVRRSFKQALGAFALVLAAAVGSGNPLRAAETVADPAMAPMAPGSFPSGYATTTSAHMTPYTRYVSPYDDGRYPYISPPSAQGVEPYLANAPYLVPSSLNEPQQQVQLIPPPPVYVPPAATYVPSPPPMPRAQRTRKPEQSRQIAALAPVGRKSGYYVAFDLVGTHSFIRDHKLENFSSRTLDVRHEDDQVAGNSLAIGMPADFIADGFRLELEAGVRYRFDLDYRTISIADPTNITTGYEINLATFSAMTNLYYDFDLGSSWTPFAGAGIGYARHWAETERVENSTATRTSHDFYTDNFVWSAIAGVNYQINPRWGTYFKTRYIDLGDVEVGAFSTGETISSKYRSVDFMFGVTYAL